MVYLKYVADMFIAIVITIFFLRERITLRALVLSLNEGEGRGKLEDLMEIKAYAIKISLDLVVVFHMLFSSA